MTLYSSSDGHHAAAAAQTAKITNGKCHYDPHTSSLIRFFDFRLTFFFPSRWQLCQADISADSCPTV